MLLGKIKIDRLGLSFYNIETETYSSKMNRKYLYFSRYMFVSLKQDYLAPMSGLQEVWGIYTVTDFLKIIFDNVDENEILYNQEENML